MMTPLSQQLQESISRIEVEATYTEAVIHLCDSSRLCFCHRVDERWAKAVGPEEHEKQGGTAERILNAIATFRLNAKHLDIVFSDGSRWDQKLTSG